MRPLDLFDRDRTRSLGRAYICKDCRHRLSEPAPRRYERLLMRARGLRWCVGCKAWLLADLVERGRCRAHHRVYERERYAADATYRAERRQHAHGRKRGVAPVPVVGQETILEEFEGTCAYCPAPATTFDHVLAVERGGKTEPWNIVPACVSCNSSKGTRDVWEWLLATGRMAHDRLIQRTDMEHSGALAP